MKMKFKFHQQKGAALFVCLMLLTVLTLLGLSSITTTTMEEKMAGNVRNKHLAFQAAEAALRAGEIDANGLDPDRHDTFSDIGTNGYYNRSVPGDSSPKPAFPVWNQSGVNWQDAPSAGTGLVANPQYIIELYGTSFRDTDCALAAVLAPDCPVPVYRVTAQGWGVNTNTSTIIQSTYKQF